MSSRSFPDVARRMSVPRVLFGALALLAGLQDPATAAGDSAKQKTVEAELREYLSVAPVPDPLTLSAIGDSVMKVEKPGSIRTAIGALDSVYLDGKLVPGGAIEVSPWNLTLGKEAVYQPKPDLFRWLASGLSAGVGVAKEADRNGNLKAAIGLRLRVVDDTDWRLNTRAIDDALRYLEELDEEEVPISTGSVEPFAPVLAGMRKRRNMAKSVDISAQMGSAWASWV